MKLFALAFGSFLGLALLKFPNPPVVEFLITEPTNGWEWALMAWPVRYAYPLIIILGLLGLALIRLPKITPKWPLLLPLAWFVLVWLSAGQSIDPKVSSLTVIHFAIAVTCFYLGLLVVSRLTVAGWLLAGLVVALVLVVAVGFEQHFGGLEASRQQFLAEWSKTKEPPPPELLKRMEGGRIFGTMFYPNSLAGALLLLTPVVLGLIVDAKRQFTSGARGLLAGGVGLAAIACLFWTKSKAGWLLALAMMVVVLLRLPIRRQVKLGVLVALVVAGLAGFVVRNVAFIKKGAPSAVERVNYWKAALQNVAQHPVVGSGPGTFATVYKRVKPPEAEMARLTHNDYLQQASDSGMLAGLLLLATVAWVIWSSRRLWKGQRWMLFSLWLGLVGFGAQSFVEFGFYIPATSWCWFGLAGWLVSRGGLEFDKANPPA
ncbi:MAG: hypothetical protein RLY20_1656 [Verrucomicrobiota bacterium]